MTDGEEFSGRLSREMEFDFVDGSAGGTFVATDSVRSVIMGHLHRGEIDRAATHIASSGPEVGDRLLNDDAKMASAAVREALAEAFVKARDFERAGKAALLIGDPARAAPFFERSYQFAQAAQLYEKDGQLERAAELYERDLRYDQAAKFYEQSGQIERAAAVCEKARNFYDAGRHWTKAHRMDRAVDALQQVEPKSPSWAKASLLLGRILEHAGHREAACAQYIQVVKACPIDAVVADIYERLAAIYVVVGEAPAAAKLYNAVLKFDPTRKKASEALTALGAPRVSALPPQPSLQQPGATTRAGTPGPAAPVPAAAPAPAIFSAHETPGASGVKPLVLPTPPSAAAKAESVGGSMTAVNVDVEALRNLPLFSELSLDELRALQSLGARKKFASSTILIEQGQEGAGLFVILSGKVRVLHLDDAGAATQLGELGFGASVGEMALVDEGPTSARVQAVSEGEAFVWPMDRMRKHLGTHEGTALRILKVVSRTLSVRLRETNRRAAVRSGSEVVDD